MHPNCRACGRCCDFHTAGHRLFVMTAELTLLVAPASLARAACAPLPPVEPLKCPFQVKGRCAARGSRPLGCRVYYCAEALASPTDDVYERFHAEFQTLHSRFDLPYFYVELTAGLTIYRNSL
jgi:Fe-S-cluster containining protein